MLLRPWPSLRPISTPTSSNSLFGGALMKCSGTFTALANQSPNISPDPCSIPAITSSPAIWFLEITSHAPTFILGLHAG
ncbi:hypothetical protein ACHAXS_000935 [Conticribra weissflogii]